MEIKLLFPIISFVIFASAANSAGKPTGDPERLLNGKPDYHQYEGQILEVIDADTIKVKMYLLPGLSYEINVRSRGVDAPEIRRPGCDWERELGMEAKAAVSKSFELGEWIYVENVEPDSFGSRIVGDIKQWYGNQRWRTVSSFLLEKDGRWGVEYVKGDNFDWCRTLD